jgi:hypothetical protein
MSLAVYGDASTLSFSKFQGHHYLHSSNANLTFYVDPISSTCSVHLEKAFTPPRNDSLPFNLNSIQVHGNGIRLQIHDIDENYFHVQNLGEHNEIRLQNNTLHHLFLEDKNSCKFNLVQQPPVKMKLELTEKTNLLRHIQNPYCFSCTDEEATRLLQPCGHLCFCKDCWEEYTRAGTKSCPLCKVYPDRVLQAYITI